MLPDLKYCQKMLSKKNIVRKNRGIHTHGSQFTSDLDRDLQRQKNDLENQSSNMKI